MWDGQQACAISWLQPTDNVSGDCVGVGIWMDEEEEMGVVSAERR